MKLSAPAWHARVADAVCLTYRTPAASVAGLLPAGLELVRRGPWAFWQVEARRVEHLRPARVPAPVGLSYHQVAYRLRVQAMTASAEVVTGVYDVHRVVDAPLPARVALLGGRPGGPPPVRGHIAWAGSDCGVRVGVEPGPAGGAHALRLELAHAPAARRDGSCFATLADVREHCAPSRTRLTPEGRPGPAGAGRLCVSRARRVGRTGGGTPLVVREASLGCFEQAGQAEHAELEWAVRLRPAEERWERHAPVPLVGRACGDEVRAAGLGERACAV
jgi:hypothetical protein